MMMLSHLRIREAEEELRNEDKEELPKERPIKERPIKEEKR
jgi:hypothetical protein